MMPQLGAGEAVQRSVPRCNLGPAIPAVIPAGGWLGSGADEGRAKLRKARGRRKEP